MIISVSGFGYSGSGAVLDYLKEFDQNEILTKIEMNILYIPDGIMDLEYHLCKNHYRFMSSDVAIQRFLERMEIVSERLDRKYRTKFINLSRDYVFSLVQVQWKGYSFIHRGEFNKSQRYWRFKFPFQVKYLLSRIKINIPSINLPQREMYLSVNPENFYTATVEYVKSVISLFSSGAKGKNIIIDQLFAADNIGTCIKFVPGCKVITVVRDPRDIYLLLKEGIHPKITFIPTEDVHDFVTYYLAIMNSKEDSIPEELIVQYEDLIYNYEDTTHKICDHLNLEWSSSKEYFDPAISIRNTQLFRRYPQYANDIKYIEEKCKDYLYPFDESIDIDMNKELF